jgi:hypothetical protein
VAHDQSIIFSGYIEALAGKTRAWTQLRRENGFRANRIDSNAALVRKPWRKTIASLPWQSRSLSAVPAHISMEVNKDILQVEKERESKALVTK